MTFKSSKKITPTSGELLEKRKSNNINNYSSTFSGYNPKGGDSFSLHIMKLKYQNLEKSKTYVVTNDGTASNGGSVTNGGVASNGGTVA